MTDNDYYLDLDESIKNIRIEIKMIPLPGHILYHCNFRWWCVNHKHLNAFKKRILT